MSIYTHTHTYTVENNIALPGLGLLGERAALADVIQRAHGIVPPLYERSLMDIIMGGGTIFPVKDCSIGGNIPVHAEKLTTKATNHGAARLLGSAAAPSPSAGVA